MFTLKPRNKTKKKKTPTKIQVRDALRKTGLNSYSVNEILGNLDPHLKYLAKEAIRNEETRRKRLDKSIVFLTTQMRKAIRDISKQTSDALGHTFGPVSQVTNTYLINETLTVLYPESIYPLVPDLCQCGAPLIDNLDFVAGACRNCFSKSVASQKQPKIQTRRKKYSDAQNTRRLINEMIFDFFGGSCAICGYNEPIHERYTCHHVDPNIKSFGLARAKSTLSNWDSIIVPELEKCVLLCLFCHTMVHKHLRSPQGLPERVSRRMTPGKRPVVDASIARLMGF